MSGSNMRAIVRAIIGAAAAAGLVTTAGCTRFGGKKNADSGTAEVGVPVVVAAAERATMAQTLTVTGTIKAVREADVSAQVSAEVLKVTVREGDPVTEGQVLVRLDREQTRSAVQQARAGVEADAARLEAAKRRLEILELGARDEERAIARSRLEQAESALRTAEADLNRLRGLFEQGAVSKQQLDGAQVAYDTARTNRVSALKSLELTEKGPRHEEVEAARKEVEAAAAALEQANGMLSQARDMDDRCTIRSPLTGIVVERSVEPGEVTGMGEPLLVLADPSSVYCDATVPERVALRVHPGQRVEVTVQGNGDRTIAGRVERLVPVAHPARRDFLLRISITDDAGLTKPGMFARGAVVVLEKNDVVVIPKQALLEREGEPVVFVVTGDTVEARPVVLGLVDRTRVEIIGGVDAWETVVVAGAESLQDGQTVRVRTGGGD